VSRLVQRFTCEVAGRAFSTYAATPAEAIDQFASATSLPTSGGCTIHEGAAAWPARYRERGDADWRVIKVSA